MYMPANPAPTIATSTAPAGALACPRWKALAVCSFMRFRLPCSKAPGSRRHDVECIAPAHDAAAGRRGKMRRAYERRCIANAAEQLPPRFPRLFRVAVRHHPELRIARLQRRMDHVAGDDRVGAGL